MKYAKNVFTLRDFQSLLCHMDAKKRLVVSYKNCPEAVLEAIRQKYPSGYNDDLIKIEKPNGDLFHAITVETDEACYLVKVDVKIDNLSPEELDKALDADLNNEQDGEGSFENEGDAAMDRSDDAPNYDE